MSKKLIGLIFLILFIFIGGVTYEASSSAKFKEFQNNNKTVSSKKTVEAVTKEINLENSKELNIAK